MTTTHMDPDIVGVAGPGFRFINQVPVIVPVAGKTYLFRVPYYGFYIKLQKKVGFGAKGMG